MALNFTITGYPLTFVIMLAVSLIISTLTTGIRKQERMLVSLNTAITERNASIFSLIKTSSSVGNPVC